MLGTGALGSAVALDRGSMDGGGRGALEQSFLVRDDLPPPGTPAGATSTPWGWLRQLLSSCTGAYRTIGCSDGVDNGLY